MDLVFEMDRAEKAKCPICDSTFSHLGNLRAHLIKKHGKSIEEAKVITSTIDEVRFECRLCQVKCRDRRVHETSNTHLKNVAKAKAKARFQRCDRRHVSSGSEDEAAVDVPAPKRRRVEKPQKRAPIEKNSQQAVARRVSEIPEVPDLDLINDSGNHRVRMVKQVKPTGLIRRRLVSSSSEDERDPIPRPPPVEAEATRPVQGEFGQIFDRESMWKAFLKDTAPSVKGKPPKTYKLYRDKMMNFEAFIKKTDPSFQLHECANVGSTTRFRKLPSCLDWAAEWDDSASSKSLALNAYKRFIRFLTSLIIRIEDKLPEDLQNRRSKFLDLKYKQANDLSRQTAPKLIPEKMERQRRAAEMAAHDGSAAPRGDYIQLKTLVEQYRVSDYRTTWYQRCKDLGLKGVLRDHDWTKIHLRNFLMFEVFFESFGQRPDTVRNMTMLELFNAEKMDDEKNVVIEVKIHKTCSTYGPAQMQIPRVLWDLVREFCREIRPKFNPLPEAGDFVFLTTTGKQMEDLSEAIDVFTAVVKPKFKVLPMHFRSMCSTLGQTHPDVAVRSSVPSTMNHSQETAKGYYFDAKAKKTQHLGLKAKVIGMSANLPEPKEKDSEADIQFQEELNRKDREAFREKELERKSRRRRRDN